MNRRKLLAGVGSAATVGVAGCTGNSTDDSSNDTDGESEDSETLSLEEFAFPEYAAEESLEAAEFVPAHFDHIRNEGSATISLSTEDVFDGNSFNSSIESRISSNGILATEEGEQTTSDHWSEVGRDRGLIRRDSGFQTTFQITGDSPTQEETLFESESTIVAKMFDFSETASPAELEGTLTARYDVTTIANTQPDGRTPFGADEITDGTASLFVTEDGTVKRFTYEIDYQSRGRSQSRSVDVTYSGLGTTDVSEPDWTQTAREKGREFDITVTDDGYVTLTMVNGEPIPAGTMLSLGLSRGAELPAELTVDDRVVVAVTERGISIEINEKPTSESNFDSNFLNVSFTSNRTPLYRESVDLFSR
jgi:hypothetical protein